MRNDSEVLGAQASCLHSPGERLKLASPEETWNGCFAFVLTCAIWAVGIVGTVALLAWAKLPAPLAVVVAIGAFLAVARLSVWVHEALTTEDTEDTEQ